jgi:hypothetical protein
MNGHGDLRELFCSSDMLDWPSTAAELVENLGLTMFSKGEDFYRKESFEKRVIQDINIDFDLPVQPKVLK